MASTTLSEPASEIESTKPTKVVHRQNGFDLIRLLAAALVIYGHSFPLSGAHSPGFLANGIQTIAVKVFFVTSGFLICKSWTSDPHLYRYAIRRALRIMPGLGLVLVITVFLFGPVFTSLRVGQYFGHPLTWHYLADNLALYPVYSLPEVFAKNIYPNAVNGSLWTLPVEVFMYCLVPLFVGKAHKSARIVLPLIAGLSLLYSLYYNILHHPQPSTVVYGTSVASLMDVCVYFQIGSTYAILNLERFTRPALSMLLFIAPLLLSYDALLGELSLFLLLPYMVISVGTTHIKWVNKLLNGQDLSYGLYLYGFLVQQSFQALFKNHLSPHSDFYLSLAVSLIFAFFSWHVIEKRALAFKPRRRSVG